VTFKEDNAQALEYARKHGLAQSAGSDAHTLLEVGRAYVEVPPFKDATEFLAGLKRSNVQGKLSSMLIHASSRWATMLKILGLAKKSKAPFA
jgi:hypothetical protein